MELNSNIIIVIVAILLCVMALTYAMLSVQKSLNTIVRYIKHLSKSKKDKTISETPDLIVQTSSSRLGKFRNMIIPTALLVLAFCINNIDKIIDFIAPDPIEETNIKLTQIVEQIQPSTKIEMPDSLEQTIEVKQIRKIQDRIQYFNLSLKMLKETPNNLDDVDADSTIVSFYYSLMKEFKQTNEAFAEVIQCLIMSPKVHSYLNINSLLDYYKYQQEYTQTETLTLNKLEQINKAKKTNMRKFQSTMLEFADASYRNTDMQMDLIRRIDIAINLALLDIKK